MSEDLPADERVTDEELGEIEREGTEDGVRVRLDAGGCHLQSDARALLAAHKNIGTELSTVGRICFEALHVVDQRNRLARELRALRAPVDVEDSAMLAEIDRRARECFESVEAVRPAEEQRRWSDILDWPDEAAAWREPHVQYLDSAARLQREAEELRAEAARIIAMTAGIGFLVPEEDTAEGRVGLVLASREAIAEESEAARAEIERLKGELATEYAARGDDIRNLTKIADAWKALAKACRTTLDKRFGPLCRPMLEDEATADTALRALGIDPEAP